MDGWEAPWDGKLFAYKGNVINGTLSIISFPTDAFNVTEAAWLYSVPQINELLAQDEHLQLLAPPPNDAVHIDELMTRWVMYLPAKYMTLFLDSCRYMICEAWQRLIIPMLEQNQELVICKELVNWMWIAITTARGAGDAPPRHWVILEYNNWWYYCASHRWRSPSTSRKFCYDRLALKGERESNWKGAILQLAKVVAANMRDTQETRLVQDEENERKSYHHSIGWPC